MSYAKNLLTYPLNLTVKSKNATAAVDVGTWSVAEARL
jgi:hypothetical protein